MRGLHHSRVTSIVNPGAAMGVAAVGGSSFLIGGLSPSRSPGSTPAVPPAASTTPHPVENRSTPRDRGSRPACAVVVARGGRLSVSGGGGSGGSGRWYSSDRFLAAETSASVALFDHHRPREQQFRRAGPRRPVIPNNP